MTLVRTGSEVTFTLTAQQRTGFQQAVPTADGGILVASAVNWADPWAYARFSPDGTSSSVTVGAGGYYLQALADGNVLQTSGFSNNSQLSLAVLDVTPGDAQRSGSVSVALPNQSILSDFSVAVLSGANAGKVAVTYKVFDYSGSGANPAFSGIFDLATGSIVGKLRPLGDQAFFANTITNELSDGRILIVTGKNTPANSPFGMTYSFAVESADGKSLTPFKPLALMGLEGDAQHMKVAALAGGGFAVIWQEGFQSAPTLHAQTFAVNGTATSADIIVSTSSADMVTDASIVGLKDGSFAVAWSSANEPGVVAGTDIFLRVFGAKGDEIGKPQLVNTTTTGDQVHPELKANADGGLTVFWGDTGTSADNIHSRTFASQTGAKILGTVKADVLEGTAYDDIFYSSSGNDTYKGNGGDDTVSFATAKSATTASLATNGPVDTVSSGSDTFVQIRNLVGSAFDDTLYGNALDNRLDGGAGNDRLVGSQGNDILIGGGGNDVLVGGPGADRMEGGWGNDSYFVDHVNDVVIERRGSDPVTGEESGLDRVTTSVDFTLPANVELLFLAPGAGNISGTGNALANQIYGNEGNNVLNGGGGLDALTGGAGSDTFMFTADPVAANKVVIRDFTPGIDKLAFSMDTSWWFGFVGEPKGALDPAEFGYGKAATSWTQSLVYDKVTGNLFYDADGMGNQPMVKIATLSGAPDLHASDIILV